MHDRVREVTGIKKNAAPSCTEAKDGTVLIEEEEILQRWKEYISDLFADDQRQKTDNHEQ